MAPQTPLLEGRTPSWWPLSKLKGSRTCINRALLEVEASFLEEFEKTDDWGLLKSMGYFADERSQGAYELTVKIEPCIDDQILQSKLQESSVIFQQLFSFSCEVKEG